MKLPSLIICLLSAIAGLAQSYNVALIPDSLKQNADAVMRYEEMKIIIKSPGKAVVKHTYAVTVLNQKAKRYATFAAFYNKFSDINSIDGTLYNAEGKELKNVKKRDIQDWNGTSEISLIEDTRYKVYSFSPEGYPYTVKFESEEEKNGVFAFSPWMPISDDNFSVQQSKFVVEAPVGYQVRYKQLNFKIPPVVSQTDKGTVYQWEMNNQPAFGEEEYLPHWSKVLPVVFVAPSEFEYGGYKGNMSTWKDFGKYIYQLYIGKNELPASIKQDIHQLTDGLVNRDEKIRVLYEYMQKNTRYISIQLGIGGLQPFDASYVAEKKYGDCKALSNYMVSILKEAGIEAYPVIIKGDPGIPPVIEDFPSNQFNHAVMCIPGKDTTWLECTSQTESCGYMGSFTGNRKGVLIKEDGGYLVSTPRYGLNENLQLRRADATIDAEGNLTANVSTRYTGIQQDRLHFVIHVFTEKQKEQFLNSQINLPTYKVEQTEYKEQKGKLPVVDQFLKITAPGYASITGKRLFIQPNLFNKSNERLAVDKPRRFDIGIHISQKDADTLHITVPDGYSVESLPKDISLKDKWGKYNISFRVNGNVIDVLRTNESYEGVYPASDYTAFAKFMEDIYKADRSKIVLVKKE
jgi:transglutaminase-like putative cysteine protease